jgi:signal transduction histidine kinase
LLLCVAVFAIAFGAIAYVASFSARQLDESAQAASEHLFGTALQGLRDDLNGRTYDYAWWDTMLEQAESGVDPDWADDNIGAYMQTDFGHSGTFVLGPDHGTIFADNADEALPTDGLAFLGAQAADLLDAVQSQSMTESHPVSSFVSVRDRLFLVSAAPITAEYPEGARLIVANRPVLIYHRELDETLVSEIADRFALPDLSVHVGRPAAGGVPIAGVGGDTVAWAAWERPLPGDALIDKLLPIVFAATVVLLIASATIYSLWFRAKLEASRAKSVFFAKMTHELRTPLNPILGFSDIMRRELMGPLPEKYRGYADDIHRGGSHLKQLIDDVLDVSKLEADRITLRERVVDVNRVLDDVADLSVPETGEAEAGRDGSRLAFRRDIEPDLPNLKADDLRLRQILINLLSNAAKYGSTEDILVRAKRDGDGGVRIDVEDHGPGIPKADLERVFEPFAQSIDVTRPRAGRGTGLGLGISRDLMRLHGGTLTLSSEEGIGTTASLVFPKSRSIPRAAESA